ncbi:MAG: class I tRNA ligase family protein, partial [Halobacteriales archaeon]|nr:class I tRNA ligase family protein [Halobacteriales archaeon]
WFLKYNDPEWMERTERAVERLTAIPESTRDEYYHTIDWLNEWPCIRNYGLGTRLPWDQDFVIEPLSDSTIYMAYYTMAHRLSEIPTAELDRDFFDALFYGPEAVEDPDERALSLREEWEYWYPVDFRCSGNDLISNHLTFFLYHHADLFPEEKWPEGITIMGMGLLEGEKMSSSKGHVVLPQEAIDTYGADTVRFFLLNSAEPWQDYDWRADQVASTERQLRRFWSRADELIEGPPGEEDLTHEDRWLLSKLQALINRATEAMDGFETRTASQAAFYDFAEHLRWYRKRTDTDRPGARYTLREVLSVRLRLLSPFIPFMANELHERLTGEPVEEVAWPTVDPRLESPVLEAEEELVRSLVDDIREVSDVTGADPSVIRVYTAAEWKDRAYREVAETGPDMSAAMGRVMQYDSIRDRSDAAADLVQELVSFVREQSDETVQTLTEVDETDVYERAIPFLEAEFDAEVEVYREGPDIHDPGDRAAQSVPFRPAIHLE